MRRKIFDYAYKHYNVLYKLSNIFTCLNLIWIVFMMINIYAKFVLTNYVVFFLSFLVLLPMWVLTWIIIGVENIKNNDEKVIEESFNELN